MPTKKPTKKMAAAKVPAKSAAKLSRGKPAAPRRLRLPPEERRAQIIAAARALFAEGGLDRVSMRNIAARVGITQAAIYQHFVDKDAILFAVAEVFFLHLIEAKERNFSLDMPPIEKLRLSMRTYINNGLAHPEEYRLVFMTDAPGLRRHAPAALTEKALTPEQRTENEIQPSKGQIAYSHLQELIRELIAQGHIRKGDPETVAEAIWTASHGLVTLLITHTNFMWSPEALINSQLDMLLYGLLPDDSPARSS